MGHERTYHTWALVYVICGMSLGIVMAVSHDARYLSPAHVLLVGFVLSLVYGLIHKLWLISTHTLLAFPLFMQHLLRLRQAGALTMFTALLLMYGNVFLNEQTQPVHAAAALTALMAATTLLYMARFTSSERA